MAAKENPLHDHPRSKKPREQQDAKKGNVKTGRELLQDSDAAEDDTYESVGTSGLDKDDPESVDPKERADANRDWREDREKGKDSLKSRTIYGDQPKGGTGFEIWRKRA